MSERVDRSQAGEHGEVRMGRKYTLAYKTRILAELDAAEKGEKGIILRREGLYSSTSG